MPTGYTADIKDGISFETYAMNCARAFGALIDMRDAPSGAEIPERFEPSPYHMDQLEQAHARLADLKTMKPEDISAGALLDWMKKTIETADAVRERNDLKAKYEAMLDAVDKWQPPTSDHVEMKDFMRQQIVDSVKWDCDTSYYVKEKRPTDKEWLDRKMHKAKHDIAYHEKAYIEEVDRTEKRNKWMAALRESLKQNELSREA